MEQSKIIDTLETYHAPPPPPAPPRHHAPPPPGSVLRRPPPVDLAAASCHRAPPSLPCRTAALARRRRPLRGRHRPASSTPPAAVCFTDPSSTSELAASATIAARSGELRQDPAVPSFPVVLHGKSGESRTFSSPSPSPASPPAQLRPFSGELRFPCQRRTLDLFF